MFQKIRTYANVFYFSVRVSSSHDWSMTSIGYHMDISWCPVEQPCPIVCNTKC